MRTRAGGKVVALMATYEAIVTKDGQGWLVRVPDMDRYAQAL